MRSLYDPYAEKDIFQLIEKVIDIPIAIVFLVGHGRSIDKKKKRRGKIDQEGQDNPEFLSIVDQQHRRIVHLLVQVENAVHDDQYRFRRGGQGIEGLVVLDQEIGNGDDIEEQGSSSHDQLKDPFLKGQEQEKRKEAVFQDSERGVKIQGIESSPGEGIRIIRHHRKEGR